MTVAHAHDRDVDEVGDDLLDMIADLTRTRTHREPYTITTHGTHWTRAHVTTVPSLLWQLEHATPTKADGETGPGGFKSQPAAWLESLDAVARIDFEAHGWIRRLGRPVSGSTPTEALVVRVGSLMPAVTRCRSRRGRPDGNPEGGWCCQWHAVAHDVRRWWTQARIVTGWQSPAWRPNNTCPVCGVRGGLRVRLSDQGALCVECRETWTTATIGLLAEHMRAENGDRAGEGAGEGGALDDGDG